MNSRISPFVLTMMVFGFAFLYVPILLMIVYSFNASRLVTVWDAAHSPTLKWYGELLSNGEVLDAAPLPGREDVGALRIRTFATKNQPCAAFPGREGEGYEASVILDFDYWALLPR